MLSIFSKERYFKKRESEFLEYLHKKNGTKLTKENLTFAFFDLKGNAYYKFNKDMALPMARLGKMYEYMMWLSSGVTGDELNSLLDYADKALTEGIKNTKNAAKIGFIISELKDRKNMVVHPELFYNIIAVQIIRGDESITEFNNEIQMQKVEAFKKLDTHNDTFFLNIQEYLAALNLSKITKEQYLNVLKDSAVLIQATLKVLKGESAI